MCFETESPELASSTVVKCRKPHKCEECRETIPAGDFADYQTGRFDGEWYRFHLCGACELTRQKLSDHERAEGCHWSESWCPIGDLSSYCLDAGIERATHEDGQAYLAGRR